MPSTKAKAKKTAPASASAPGKIILFGEHAVVYGRPAIAVPVTGVGVTVTVSALPDNAPGRLHVTARQVGIDSPLADLPADHPLSLAVTSTMAQMGVNHLPALRLEINSTIPIAAGLGSGAAVSAAIARALAAYTGMPLSDEQVSAVAYRVDQKHHGTPSGIDNTVIAYAQPIWFVRGLGFERLTVAEPFTVVIGDSGVSSPTGAVVGDLRKRRDADPERYEPLFDAVGAIAAQARALIEQGPSAALGPLMTRNHALLQTLDVSSPQLDRLVQAALDAGALGAKLCGGGRGGNMIALVTGQTAPYVADALQAAGAAGTITTTIRG